MLPTMRRDELRLRALHMLMEERAKHRLVIAVVVASVVTALAVWGALKG